MARLTKEQYKQVYNLLYTKISKATAETENGKTIYRGTLADLFEDAKVCSNTITVFLWAVSHKTNALPTILFKISNIGKGVEISRVHSGFYDSAGNHIIGTELVPFIMAAMREYKPTRTYTRKEVLPIKDEPDITKFSEDELYLIISKCEAEIRRREELQAKQARIQTILESVGMSKEELLDLLGVC